MAQRFFELDKNSFSRYLGRGVCFAIELSHSSWDETYYLVNNTKPLKIDDSNIWTWTSAVDVGSYDWYDVAYGDDKYVAVGENGYITTSTDGETWTTPVQVGTQDWYGVTYGNGKFVAVNNYFVSTSTDGINWTTPTQASGTALDVTYGNNKFVKVGYNYSSTSTDGVTWTTPVQFSQSFANNVIYANNMFVAVGFNGYVSTSADGTTWTTPTRFISDLPISLNIAYGNGKFVVVGDDGYMSTSTDCVTWTSEIQVGTSKWNGITFANGQFLAVGNGYTSTSTDGVNWTTPKQKSFSMNNTIYGNNEFVVVGNSGKITSYINGAIYQPYPFDIILPAQTEQQGTQIVFSNIQNLAANLIRQTVDSNENITLQLYVVNVESETAEKYDKGLFEIFNPQITSETVQATINLRHSFDINCGSMRYNRQLFPNLFL